MINGTWPVMFCPMETTGITMIPAIVVGTPIGSFTCVTVIAKFGAGEERVQGIGREDRSIVEHEDLWSEGLI